MNEQALYQSQEREQALARMKSYTGAAILVFLLYLFFYPVGLVANLIYYKEAQHMERMAGTSLPGTSALGFMIFLNIAFSFMAIGGFMIVLFLVAAGSN